MSAHSPLAVANKLLERARETGKSLTPMHLQKLVYIAHGWSLALLDEPLVRTKPEAWAWGPVYRELYDATKKYGAQPVDEYIHHNNWAVLDHIKGRVVNEKFDESEEELIKAIFDEYADLKAFQLSALTHQEGTPWKEMYNRDKNVIIPDERIKSHFQEIAESNAAATQS